MNYRMASQKLRNKKDANGDDICPVCGDACEEGAPEINHSRIKARVHRKCVPQVAQLLRDAGLM
jgi:hypothetical protein